tara:strand:- start:142 stop:1647 length:1506 start_codon:yes stop_codon:yes gene_type:complete
VAVGFSQTVENLEQRIENKRIIITFDLTDDNPSDPGSYDITLTAKHSDGTTTKPMAVAGDYKDVKAGPGLKILWEPILDVLSVEGWTVSLSAVESEASIDRKFNTHRNDGDDYFEKKQWRLAIEHYRAALRIKSRESDVLDQIKNAEIEIEYHKFMQQGDDHYSNKQWLEAKTSYEKALTYKPSTSLSDRIRSAEKEYEFDKHENKADDYFNLKQWVNSQKEYEIAQSILPAKDPFIIKDRLKQIGLERRPFKGMIFYHPKWHYFGTYVDKKFCLIDIRENEEIGQFHIEGNHQNKIVGPDGNYVLFINKGLIQIIDLIDSALLKKEINENIYWVGFDGETIGIITDRKKGNAILYKIRKGRKGKIIHQMDNFEFINGPARFTHNWDIVSGGQRRDGSKLFLHKSMPLILYLRKKGWGYGTHWGSAYIKQYHVNISTMSGMPAQKFPSQSGVPFFKNEVFIIKPVNGAGKSTIIGNKFTLNRMDDRLEIIITESGEIIREY